MNAMGYPCSNLNTLLRHTSAFKMADALARKIKSCPGLRREMPQSS
jgi:hypothetical protein